MPLARALITWPLALFLSLYGRTAPGALVPLPPASQAECTELVVWQGPQGGYRMMSRLPRVRFADRPTRIVVYSSANGTQGNIRIPLMLRQADEELRAAGRQGLDVDVVETAKFDTMEAFLEDFHARTGKADVVYFSGHANPGVIDLNGTLEVTSQTFRGLDLRGKTVIVSGCNSAACLWSPDMFRPDSVRRHLVGTRVDPDEALAEGIMRNAAPDYVIGTVRTTDNTGQLDDARFINSFFVRGGARHIEGFRSIERVDDRRTRPGESVASLLRLREGSEGERIRYLDQMQAWRDYGYDADSQLLPVVREWLADAKTGTRLHDRALDFLFDNDGAELRALIAEMPLAKRLEILGRWMRASNFQTRFQESGEPYLALAKGDPKALGRLLRALPAATRLRLLLDTYPGDRELVDALAGNEPAELGGEERALYRMAVWASRHRFWTYGGVSLRQRVRAFLDPKFVAAREMERRNYERDREEAFRAADFRPGNFNPQREIEKIRDRAQW